MGSSSHAELGVGVLAVGEVLDEKGAWERGCASDD